MTPSLFLEPQGLFKDNTEAEDIEFSWNQARLWEKRDSEKQIKQNKAELKLLSDGENDLFLKETSCNYDEDIQGHTKPGHSDDIPSVNEAEIDIISILEISQKLECKQLAKRILPHINQTNSKMYDDVAVTLQNTQEYETKKEGRQANASNTLGYDEDVVDINSVLEFAKRKDEQKEEGSFEWNNFLVRRACFRGVSVYYKSKFSKINTSWQRKRVNKKKKTPMHELIKEFAIVEFGKNQIDGLTEEQWVQFRSTLYSILFSHRYKKNDDFLEGVDFELIRGVLYSYTTESRVELMKNPFFSLMILNFLEHGKQNFIKNKVKGKPKLYSDEIQTELDSLQEEAVSYLKESNFYDN